MNLRGCHCHLPLNLLYSYDRFERVWSNVPFVFAMHTETEIDLSVMRTITAQLVILFE